MWTERQLKLLEAGGNAKLHDFVQKFDLNSVEIKIKYWTRAMMFYRRRNEAEALGRDFTEEEPSVEEGRKLQDGSTLDKDGKLVVAIAVVEGAEESSSASDVIGLRKASSDLVTPSSDNAQEEEKDE